MTKISELKAKYAAIKKEMQENGETALKEVFSEFFEKHPEVMAIVWTQFTPYFNDGDACTFSVHEPSFKIDLDHIEKLDEKVKKNLFRHDDEDEYRNDPYNVYESCYYSAIYSLKQKTDDQNSFIQDAKLVEEAFGLEEIFEGVFGDHVKVIATRKGFEIEEYRHD